MRLVARLEKHIRKIRPNIHNFEFATDLNEDENTNVEEATNVPQKECPLNGALLAENTIFEIHRKIQTFGVF